jgi:iron complex outermembrane receptor protein
VERVEVLRGPQSTLYGRNAEAGVVSVITRQPGDAPYAALSGEAGSHGQRTGSLELGRALVPGQLYLGLSGEWREHDGFIRHQTTGQRVDGRERQSGRFVLRWTPSAATEASLRYAAQRWDDGASLWGSIQAPRASVNSGTEGWNHSRGRTLSLDVSHRFGPGLRLRSITARNVFDDRVLQDTDFQPASLMHVKRDYRLATTSQELRLEGETRGARWLAGLYADRDGHDLRYEQQPPGRASSATACGSRRRAARGAATNGRASAPSSRCNTSGRPRRRSTPPTARATARAASTCSRPRWAMWATNPRRCVPWR